MAHKDPRTLGELIRTARQSATPPLSQRALADLVGVRQPTVCGWEAGVYGPTTSSLVRLASVLELDTAVLLAASAALSDRLAGSRPA